jgi:transcriptional regulator with XRE-family HTH domain
MKWSLAFWAMSGSVDRTVALKIEHCVGNPSLDTLLKLANRLDTTVSALIAPTDPESA